MYRYIQLTVFFRLWVCVVNKLRAAFQFTQQKLGTFQEQVIEYQVHYTLDASVLLQ